MQDAAAAQRTGASACGGRACDARAGRSRGARRSRGVARGRHRAGGDRRRRRTCRRRWPRRAPASASCSRTRKRSSSAASCSCAPWRRVAPCCCRSTANTMRFSSACRSRYDRNPGRAGVRRLLLTASGGPFRTRALADLPHVTPDEACAHPNWRMGRKISVDSATMMNKGLEVIEAHWLFGVPAAAIKVVIHPQSVIHSLVEYVDGSVLAELGHPDMRTPIAQALAFPERIESGVAPLELAQLAGLSFEEPDIARFPALPLAFDGACRRRNGAGDPQRGQRGRSGRLPGPAPSASPTSRQPAPATLDRAAGATVAHPSTMRLAADAEARRTACHVAARARGTKMRKWRHDRPDLQDCRVPGHARRAGRVPRTRPLPGRALVRRQGAALLGRIRAHRRVAPGRSRPDGVGAVGDPARRLREDGRRARRRCRAGRPCARVQSPERVEAHRDRRGRARSPICCSRSFSTPARTWPAFRGSARCWPNLRRPRRPPRRACAAATWSCRSMATPCKAGRTCAGGCCARKAATR